MGYFTWTDANKEPEKTSDGYESSCLITKNGYNGYAKVVCPDDTEIEEMHYDGYGHFGGFDIYKLVTDWNRKDLKRLFEEKSEDDWSKPLQDIAAYYSEDGVTEDDVSRRIEEGSLSNCGYPAALIVPEWKRLIGIAIADDDDEVRKLTYPIKITSSKCHKKYEELGPSYSTQ